LQIIPQGPSANSPKKRELMKTFVLGSIVAFLLTLASGYIQGSLSNRWGISNVQRQMGERFTSFPANFGDWEMKKSGKLGSDSLNQLVPYGYFQRDYVNRKSGAAINVLALLGSCGPISVHTPEVCFASRDHQQLGERLKLAIGRDGKNSIWKTTFRLSGVDAQVLNIYYGWSAGEAWVAAENPRFSFSTRQFLYKVQITNSAVENGSADNDPANDPALQFMEDFIPALQKHMNRARAQ
jgi:hypothetical protein